MALVDICDIFKEDDLETFQGVYSGLTSSLLETTDLDTLQHVAFRNEAARILKFLVEEAGGKFYVGALSTVGHYYRRVEMYELVLRLSERKLERLQSLYAIGHKDYVLYKYLRENHPHSLQGRIPDLEKMCEDLVSRGDPELFQEFMGEFGGFLGDEPLWARFVPRTREMCHLIIESFGDRTKTMGLFSWEIIAEYFTEDMFRDEEIQKYMTGARPSRHTLEVCLRSHWYGLYDAVLDFCHARGQSVKGLRPSRWNAHRAISVGNEELADLMWPARPTLVIIREALEQGMVTLLKRHIGVGPDSREQQFEGRPIQRIDATVGHKITSGITTRRGLEAIVGLGLRSCIPQAAQLRYAELAGRTGYLGWFASTRIDFTRTGGTMIYIP